MANRLNNPNQFEALSPPWLLTSLDTNFTQNQAAWNDSSLGFVNGIPIDTGSANIYAVAIPLGAPSSYQDGMTVIFVPSNTNTGASTLAVGLLGAVAILNPAGLALQGGEIVANAAVHVVYKSAAPTGFRIIGPCSTIFTGSAGAAAQTFNCSGYTSVTIIKQVTATGAGAITLQNLAVGAPFFIIFQNSSGSSQNYGIQLSGGTNAFYVVTSAGGTILSGDFNSSFVAVANGLALRVWGTASSVILNMTGILA